MGIYFSTSAHSQSAVDGKEYNMSVAQLEAATIALRQYRIDQPKADIHHVFVTVTESSNDVAVAFQPKTNPSEVGQEGSTNYITMDNPRGNQYGQYVEYRVSKKTNKIVKTTYAR